MNPGEPAPDFALPDHEGNTVRLSQFRGRPVVLFFYPKDGTAICTAEACAFRDSYADFSKAGATVIGVSSDSAEAHRAFAATHRLPFILLSDAGGAVRKLYGATQAFGLIPGRVTFVIDPQGVVRHTFSAQLASKQHVEEAMRAVHAIPSLEKGPA
jgi:thioredoxin-dependent peroxiredoxin